MTEYIEELSNQDGGSKKSFTFIDLFCGIGGFHEALTQLGGSCVLASDIDEKCKKIYEKNYKINPQGDIKDIDIPSIPNFDVLCAGFPCQPFSKAGHQKGFDDDRGNLFFNICDIVKHHKPKYLLLENVRNLSTHDDGNTWNVIHKHILDMGYSTYDIPIILNVLHFNIPQNRERVIIMCKRNDLGPLQELPEIPKNPKLTLTRTLKDFIFDKEKDEHEKYKITGKYKDVEQVWDKFIKLLISKNISIPKFPIWTDWWDKKTSDDPVFYKKYKNWIDKNQAFYVEHKSVLGPWLKKSRKVENWTGAVRKFEWQAGEERSDDGMHTLLWTARGSGIRSKRPDYIPTLVAMSMIPVYGPQSRKLTPKELLRMQSFPDTFEFVEKDIYKQLGNAVNVDMIKKCANYLMNDQELFH